MRTSAFLSFAGIEPLELPAIPLAQHLAEKVHAYTLSYGTTGRPSTRPKDLIDILLIADSQSLEAAAVREALKHAFETRARQELLGSLPAPPPQWAPLARGARIGAGRLERAVSHSQGSWGVAPIPRKTHKRLVTALKSRAFRISYVRRDMTLWWAPRGPLRHRAST